MADRSVPVTFVQPFSSSELNSDFGDMNGYDLEKASRPLDGPPIGQRSGPRQFEFWGFLAKLRGPAGIVICGQLILMITAWGFFAAVQTRGFIALPSSTALWINAHTHLVTVIFTAIATGLAGSSCFLFSWGVRQSITLRVRGEGMSLAEFISSVRISSRSLILDAQNGRWSVMSMAVLALTMVQTSCWSGLITPSQIDFAVPLNGTEINLTNSRLQSLQSTTELDYCVFNTTFLPAFYVGQTESGYSALKGDIFIGLPAILTLMDQPFNHSTAGILPQTLYTVNTSSWFLGTDIEHIPQNIQTLVDLPEGLSFSSSTVTQQGFSANVSCEFGDLPDITAVQPTVAENIGVTSYTMSSNCVPLAELQGVPVNTATAITISEAPSYILMNACSGESDTYTLIFQGVGMYSFMGNMTCTVAPKITSVQVDYSATQTINATRVTDEAAVDVTGPAGLTAVTTLWAMVTFAQSTSLNVMGDGIRTVLQEIDPDLYNGTQSSLVSFAVQEYVRGVVEYSGSVLRACLSAPGGAFPEGVPDDMAIPTTGTLHGQIVGWREISLDTFYVMIPSTVVAIATIWVVLMTLAYHSGEPEGDPFDPANAMHIVAASAAGGLQNVFIGTEARAAKRMDDVHVVLQSIAGRPPALYVQGGMV
ncbi:hypothetical protein MSAN_02128400 [Mycena sanguinolenta]|uniref:Uncharacterized protein n=1 Tax=Mycena sanguinolenta TaxID=230812 RepID=A0A8H7CK17_9AGAR|nr:hypothetical protein MSAN_02128400 [Mycena sanguinolenta]